MMPRLAIVGPMLGRHPGHVTMVGEAMAGLFARAGHPVVTASDKRLKAWRLADQMATVFGHRREIDVLVLQVYMGRSFVAEDIVSWVSRRAGHRLVLHIHGGAMPQFVARFPGWSRRVLRRGHVLVAPSSYLARALAGLGFPARVIPNFVEIEAYPHRLRRVLGPRLFWMRAFHPIYNPEMALHTLAGVKAFAPDATLVMAGQDMGFQAEARRLASSLGLESSVRFPGFLDMAGKIREGSAADIFLNTNRIDNTPVSVIEAAALGLPVVSTNVGGIPDLLTDGETGLLTPDGDAAAMTDAVRRLLEDPTLATALSANGRRMAEGLAWSAVRPQWEALFAELTGTPSRLPKNPVHGSTGSPRADRGGSPRTGSR